MMEELKMPITKRGTTRPKPRRPPRRARASNKATSLAKRGPRALTARASLGLVAQGQQELELGDLQRLLTEAVLASDAQMKKTGARVGEMLEMMFDKGASKEVDPAAVVDLVARLDRLHRGQAQELRKHIELLTKISRPSRPTVQVLAAGQINMPDQERPSGPTVVLGEQRDARR